MPLPDWEEAGVWDSLPPKKVQEVLKKFEKLIFLGLKGKSATHYSNNQTEFFDQLLAIHTVYVISDKLARRCKWTRLEGFACPYLPLLHPFEPADLTSVPLGADNHRYARILHYFEKSKEAANGKVIFPIEPILSIEEYEKSALGSKGSSQGVNHILFLRQHVADLYPKASVSQLFPIYKYVWKNMEQTLPPEVCSLYYFAFLSSILFFGDQIEFPKALTFAEEIDECGREGLSVESKEKKYLAYHPLSREYRVAKRELSDFRFESMGIKADFIPIFDSSYVRLTTNDAVCARISEKDASSFGISEATYRDILRITRNDNLKVLLALQWASTHLIHLEHLGIQKVLDHCFFGGTGMYDRLKEEPLLIESLRKFISDGLLYFRNNPSHLGAIFFLLRTGICFESHFAEIYGKESCEKSLSFYQQKLETLFKLPIKPNEQTKVVLHLIFAQIQKSIKTPSEKLEFLKMLASFSSMPEIEIEYKWLAARLQDFKRKFAFDLEREMSDQQFCDRACFELFQFFLPEAALSVKGKKWKGVFPVFSCGDFKIDLTALEVIHIEKGGLRKANLCTKQLPAWEYLKKTHGKHFWHKEGRYESLDGQLRVGFGGSGVIHEKEILFRGERRWARSHTYTCGAIDEVKLDFLNYTEFLPYQHYILLDKRPEDPDVITYNYQTNQPVLQIQYLSSGIVMSRLDGNGYPTSIKLVNLSTLKDKNHILYRFAARFADPSRILCFVNSKASQEEELIEELNFYYLNLQFKRSKNGLESLQYPGFYLQPKVYNEELNGFPSAIVLENQFGERKVIVPAARLKEDSEEFSDKVEITKDYYSEEGKKYFIFDIDPVDGTLFSDQPTANIYLALLLAMQRDQVKALKYLNKVKLSHFLTYEMVYMLSRFTYLKDRSPAALAFDVKLLYFVCDNANFMLEEHFGKKNHEVYLNQLIAWGQQAYLDYLKRIEQEELSAIPKNLRLTFEEEQAILRTLKRFHDEKNSQSEKTVEFPQVLTLRYHLFCAKKNTVTANIAPKSLIIRAPSVKDLKKNPRFFQFWGLDNKKEFPFCLRRIENSYKWEHFDSLAYANRLTSESMEAYFQELYEQARKCSPDEVDPFDFILLACLKVVSKNLGNGDSLAHLLFYVRHFPKRFSHLSFKGVKEDLHKIRIFKLIVAEVHEILESNEFNKFEKNFLEERVAFPYARRTALTLLHQQKSVSKQLELRKSNWERKPLKPIGKLLFTRQEQETRFPEKPGFIDPKLKFASENFERD